MNEKNWDKWFDRGCYFIILLVTLYGSFETGRYFEAQKKDIIIEEIRTAWMNDKMVFYGADYYFFEVKSKLYFVKHPKHLEKKNKWNKAK